MKVINLFAGPGVGKSTTASGLFYEMKRQGYNVELVTEYAKDMVYEDRENILEDQLYILAKQNRKLERLINKVDYVITDSPLLFGVVYDKSESVNLRRLIKERFDAFDNINFYLKRSEVLKFNPKGRLQDLERAISIDKNILWWLKLFSYSYDCVDVHDCTVDLIAKRIYEI